MPHNESHAHNRLTLVEGVAVFGTLALSSVALFVQPFALLGVGAPLASFFLGWVSL